jgi:hypothetical protein
MAGFDGIITQLERQKAAIDKALEALRGIDESETLRNETPEAERQRASEVTRKGGMSPEGKQRLIAALKKRWAAKKREAKKAAASIPATSVAAVTSPTTRKGGGMTEDGRRRLAEAMKRRWAVKRAGSAVKKSGRKRAV